MGILFLILTLLTIPKFLCVVSPGLYTDLAHYTHVTGSPVSMVEISVVVFLCLVGALAIILILAYLYLQHLLCFAPCGGRLCCDTDGEKKKLTKQKGENSKFTC